MVSEEPPGTATRERRAENPTFVGGRAVFPPSARGSID